MKRAVVDGKHALFFDHRALLEQIYGAHADAGTQQYNLKEALFHFDPKDDARDDSDVVKRKRKRPSGAADAAASSAARTALDEEADWCRRVLDRIRADGAKVEARTEAELPERCWEEKCDFPQFNGANTSTAFQRTQFGARTYLIPPQCRFFNFDVRQLRQLLPELAAGAAKYDLVVLDPPWRNKYIRRLKRARSALGYSMLDSGALQGMPLGELVHARSIVAVWCTNAEQHRRALLEHLLPAWQLRLLHALKWYKVNTAGALVGPINAAAHKQPYELLYLACHCSAPPDFGATLPRTATALFSVPSIVHSHKPPLLPWLAELLPERPQCLELFARYLQPHFTAVGLEVLKLMDERLYERRPDSGRGNPTAS